VVHRAARGGAVGLPAEIESINSPSEHPRFISRFSRTNLISSIAHKAFYLSAFAIPYERHSPGLFAARLCSRPLNVSYTRDRYWRTRTMERATVAVCEKEKRFLGYDKMMKIPFNLDIAFDDLASARTSVACRFLYTRQRERGGMPKSPMIASSL